MITVTNKQGVAITTTSRKIAEVFDKRHDNVVRDIRRKLKGGSVTEDSYLNTSLHGS